jgi:hypothetical protein
MGARRFMATSWVIASLSLAACSSPAASTPSVIPTPTVTTPTASSNPRPMFIPGLAPTPFIRVLEKDGFRCYTPSKQPTEPRQHIWQCDKVDSLLLLTVNLVDEDRERIMLFSAYALLGTRAEPIDAWIALRGLCCLDPFQASTQETQSMWTAAQAWLDKNHAAGASTVTHGLFIEVDPNSGTGEPRSFRVNVVAAGRAPAPK